MNNPDILVNPSHYTYAQRFTMDGYRRKDGTKNKHKRGPYWYANKMMDGIFRTFYIGKELPDVCKPFAPETTYPTHPSNRRRGMPPLAKRGASDTILEALDRGEQVIIDLDKLAKDCGAQLSHISAYRYLIYRDPKNE